MATIDMAPAARRLDPKLAAPALDVLRARGLGTGSTGETVEAPAALFWRVAAHVAEAGRRYGDDVEAAAEAFYVAMARLEFLPSPPILMNAGTTAGRFANCFVLPVDGTLDSVFGSMRDAAVIHQGGGCVGLDFSRLRPRGTVASTGERWQGPVPLMALFEAGAQAVHRDGGRHVNMGVLDVHHPDIEAFVDARRGGGSFRHFTFNVAVDDAFMRAAAVGDQALLANPQTGEQAGRLPADRLLQRVAEAAWASGDPGLIFTDRVNRDNPLPALGRITSANPCGAVPMRPYEGCVLGAVNLSALVRRGAFDWERLDALTDLGIRFLDNCLDASTYPLPQIEAAVRRSRKIGLGVMGFADALGNLGLTYGEDSAIRFAEGLMARMGARATAASRRLAGERGPYPVYARSRDAAAGGPPVRNATRLAIGPTATLGVIAGCSSGIEPPLAASPRRRLAVPASRHLRLQAAFQAHVDNAVSKGIDLPAEATSSDVLAVYREAFELGCKSVAVRRRRR